MRKKITSINVSLFNKSLAGLFVFALIMLLFPTVSSAQSGCNTCTLNYPDNSNLPRSAVDFNENEVLRAIDPGTTSCGLAPATIKINCRTGQVTIIWIV